MAGFRCTSTRKETQRKSETHRRKTVKEIWIELGLVKEDILGRTKWKNDIHNHSGTHR